ncbi:MAG: hypothetical protein WDN30_02520 [Pararobbsia sp.]
MAGNASTPPHARDFVAIGRVVDVAVRGKQGRHAADFAAAHRVGLARERKRSRAALADLAGREVEVDQGGVLRAARRRLVQALAVERQGRAVGEPARGRDDVVGGHAADAARMLGRRLAHGVAQRLEARGMRVDECAVDHTFPEHHMHIA